MTYRSPLRQPYAGVVVSHCVGSLASQPSAGASRAAGYRICAAPDCQAVLVDLSKNRSRRYCDTGNCGNRQHVAAYRERLHRDREALPEPDRAAEPESAR